VLILSALLVPALVAVGALTIGVSSVWTSRHDVQRAADLGALAAAAGTPTAAVPLDGVALLQDLGMELDALDWQQRGCAVARNQLDEGRSPVATAFTVEGEDPAACSPTWAYESPLLAAIGKCGLDLLAGCDDVAEELLGALPFANDVLTDPAVREALDGLAGPLSDAEELATEVEDALVDAFATTYGGLCLLTENVPLLGVICVLTLGDVLGPTPTLESLLANLPEPYRSQLEDASTALDELTVGLDLAGVAPALLTPRVQLDVGPASIRPSLSPFTFEVAAAATARRVIKSAIVLPSVRMPDAEDIVVDGGVLHRDAAEVRDDVLDALEALDGELSAAVCEAYETTGETCTVPDDPIDTDRLFGPFLQDVRDATDPPPGSTPTIDQVLGYHAGTGDPVWIIGGLRPLPLEDVYGPEVWPLLDPHLVTDTTYVPALDVLPALVVRDGDSYRLQPIDPVAVLSTPGLYKARLVR